MRLSPGDAVLAAVLSLGNAAWVNVCDILHPEHFGRPDDQRLWEAARDVVASGRDLNEVALRGQLGERFPQSRFAELCEGVPATMFSPAAQIEAAKQARERAVALQLSDELRQLLLMIKSSPSDALDIAVERVRAACDGRLGESAGVPLSAVVQETWEDISGRADRGGGPEGLLTGIRPVDAAVESGMCGGELIVVAARPGLGKTAFALQVALHVQRSAPVHVASLEMPNRQLGYRWIASEARLEMSTLRSTRMTPEQWQRGTDASARLADANIFVDERKRQTVHDIRLAAKIRKQRSGLGLLIIDYLQLITPTERRAPREQQVSDMARDLKLLAVELEIPILLLAQINRDSEKEGRRPRQSDLRESGGVENNADGIWFIHKPTAPRRKEDPQPADSDREILIAKQRMGPAPQICECMWRGDVQRFEARAHSYHEAAE